VAHQTAVNGEPGYAWLENMQAFGRMCEAPDRKDWRAAGGNPCLEQSLEDQELLLPGRNVPAQP
jgi:ribonucleoside-triphosphate reductase